MAALTLAIAAPGVSWSQVGLQPFGMSAAPAPRTAAPASLSSLPAGARSAVSTAVAAKDARYAAQGAGGQFRLKGGGVTAEFGRGEMSVTAPGGQAAMGLAAMGRGDRVSPVAAVAPQARANRVSYRYRGGLVEWYAAGPMGVEQGFTVAKRPAGGSRPVTLALALRGSLRPRRAGPDLAFATRSGRTVLRYSGLAAVDAAGRPLRAWLALTGSRLLVRVDDRHARYPLQIDPFIQQGSKLTARPLSGFGFSVALSADGTTALIGAPFYEEGRAWVFVRSGQTWVQQGRPLSGAAESDNFGMSVALSADGSTALVGDAGNSNGVGAAWAFTRSGQTWTKQGPKLTGSGATGGRLFGLSVALSADGNTALVGGPDDNGSVGAAWVFTRSGPTWSQQGSKLTGSGGSGASALGWAVALSADGNTALVGGPLDNGSVGAAWVFTRSGQTWAQQGSKLTGAGETGAGRFGQSAALSADGNTALVGGPDDNPSAGTLGGVGAAWVFTRSGQTWAQQGSKLTGAGEIGAGGFGTGVALSRDGSTAMVGGQHDNGSAGAAWVFTRSGPTWSLQGSKLTASGESGSDSFGLSVALSADGNTALVGGFSDNIGLGAVWLFARSGQTWAQQGPKLTWGQIGAAKFGYSVALSADGNTALIGGPDDNGGVGAAWLFTRSGET